MRWLLAAVLLAGCSGEAHRLAEMTETIIGPSGGTARSAGGNLTLWLPPGALAKEETITIETIRGSAVPRLVSPRYQLGPRGLELALPATLELEVPGADRSLALANLDGPEPAIFTGSSQTGDVVSATLARLSACGAVMAGPAPDLEISPPSLDFGAVPLGQSAPLSLTVNNTGEAEATIDGVTVSSPFFATWSLPMTVPAGDTATLEVLFAPDAPGPAGGSLTISTSEGTRTVALSGEGAGGCVETFTQRTAPLVDVLVVVDNSGSMTEEQEILGQNAATLLGALTSSAADFHIGVITTDVEDEAARGALVGTGTTATIIHGETLGPGQLLAQLVSQGNMGSPTEEGLEAAELALTEPLASGHNAGFLREEAWLTVIFLTDEDDGSNEAIEHYRTFFLNLKGAHGARMVRVNAITGGLSGCSGAYGPAQAAPRYDAVVSDTNGVSEAICTPPWGRSLTALGGDGYGYRFAFPLAGTPSGPMEVRVGGVLVPPADYAYDAPSTTLIFTPSATPRPGLQVEVRYLDGC